MGAFAIRPSAATRRTAGHANGHPKGRGTGHGTGHDGRAACRVVALTAHVAFRRDLDRLEAAASSGKGGAAHVRAGWENLKRQIRLHHDLQERVLWPRVRRAADRADVRAVLARTRAEHARVGEAVGEVDAAMRDGAGLPGAVRNLRRALESHLRHEEMTVIPLAEAVLEPADWRDAAADDGGPGEAEAALFVPWAVDGIAPVARSRFLTALPGPLRERNRMVWEPRYRKLRLWSI